MLRRKLRNYATYYYNYYYYRKKLFLPRFSGGGRIVFSATPAPAQNAQVKPAQCPLKDNETRKKVVPKNEKFWENTDIKI